jgi:hypothetical protein
MHFGKDVYVLTAETRITDVSKANLTADCLNNVRASTSHSPVGFHGLLRGIDLL